MAVSPKFASGKYANAVCDVCGIRAKYLDLRVMSVMGRQVNIKACPTCWDPDHPQNFLPKFVRNDPQALRGARPDTGAQASRSMNPPGNWINGEPPSAAQREEWALQIEQERERQRALWRMQLEADRLRQRSF